MISENETLFYWELGKKVLAHVENEKGNKLLVTGDITNSIQAFTTAILCDPENEIFPANRAKAFFIQNRFSECEIDCTHSLAINPLNTQPLLKRGMARKCMGQLEDAMSDLERVLELQPDNLLAREVLHQTRRDFFQRKPEKSTCQVGNFEIQISNSIEEVVLHEHVNNCEKNPNHPNFIPFKKFTLKHIPAGYRDIEVYDLIKSIADLTVRVCVNFISPNRPEFWPGTVKSFPLYKDRGKSSNTLGTGEMFAVRFIQGCGYDSSGSETNAIGQKYERNYKTCPCDKCQHSDKPSEDWWEIIVFTAAHVVYDEIEAKHTTCRLFFDKPKCPMVKIDPLKLYNVNISQDRCELQYASCEFDLGDKIVDMSRRRSDTMKKVDEKYLGIPETLLCFMVSFPHGCSKQVSIGEWVENEIVEEVDTRLSVTKLRYNTCSCPGSSGATVYCLNSFFGHVHNGAWNDKLNYSSIGFCKK